MDTDITKSDFSLVMIIFLNGVKLIWELHTLKKAIKNGMIMKENLDISYPVRTLIKLDRYVSELLDHYKKKY